MTAQSPRPTAHRAFTALLAVLLVGSVVAPIAATEPATATTGDYIDGSYEGTCDSKLRFAFPISCGHSSFSADQIDTSQDPGVVETDVHVSGQTLYENWQSHDVVYQNYLEDTSTLASLEARNAIADAYENNESAIAAQAAGQTAINDYYTVHQRNLLEVQSQHTARLDYLHNVTVQADGVSSRFLHPWWGGAYNNPDDWHGGADLDGITTETYTLRNGSTVDVTVPILHLKESGNAAASAYNYRTDGLYQYWNSTRDEFIFPSNNDDSYDCGHTWPGGIGVNNAPAASLESQTVYEYAEVARRLDQLEKQAQTVQDNYGSNVAEDLYAEMDAGNLDPNDVRGAEGMVRYMSGSDDGSNITEDRFNLALRSTLDLAAADLDSTMVVDFEGATERMRIATNNSVTYEYNSVNETFEGLLFSSDTPADGFQMGQTYDVSNFDGTTTMVTDGGANETTFYQGNLTITKIYDSDGNEVESVDWQEPTYDEYNATAFIQALEDASIQREQIVTEDNGSDDSSSDVTIPNPFGDLGAGGAVVGLVVIVGAIGVVVVVVIRP